jgi:hypothetical protein
MTATKNFGYGRHKWDNNSNEKIRKHHDTTAKDQEHKNKYCNYTKQ